MVRTVLIEIEAILNSKPLGYVSADIAGLEPITPNCLLMGRPDGSLSYIQCLSSWEDVGGGIHKYCLTDSGQPL